VNQFISVSAWQVCRRSQCDIEPAGSTGIILHSLIMSCNWRRYFWRSRFKTVHSNLFVIY